MARVFLAFPTYDRKVDIEILAMVAQLPNLNPDHEFAIDFINSSLITDARNYLVRRFLETGFDWLYFWDSDVVIRDNTFLAKLLQTADSLQADIVGGAYRIKHDKGYYVAGRYVDGKLENFTKDLDLRKPMLVDALGTGSMLIHKSVFDKVSPPWFSFVDRPDGITIPEDYRFCFQAKKVGIKVALDPRFATYHYGPAFWEHIPKTEKAE